MTWSYNSKCFLFLISQWFIWSCNNFTCWPVTNCILVKFNVFPQSWLHYHIYEIHTIKVVAWYRAIFCSVTVSSGHHFLPSFLLTLPVASPQNQQTVTQPFVFVFIFVFVFVFVFLELVSSHCQSPVLNISNRSPIGGKPTSFGWTPLEFLFAVNKYKSSCFVQFLLNTRLTFCIILCLHGMSGRWCSHKGRCARRVPQIDHHHQDPPPGSTTKILHQDPPPRASTKPPHWSSKEPIAYW